MYDDTIAELLRHKTPSQLHTVSPDTTVGYAVCLMNHHAVGAVLVMRDGNLEGIFTERDVLERVVEPNVDPGATTVAAVMTPKPRTVKTTDRVTRAVELMVRGKFRHVPVMEGKAPCGIVSMRDLNAWLIRNLVGDDPGAATLAKALGAEPGDTAGGALLTRRVST